MPEEENVPQEKSGNRLFILGVIAFAIIVIAVVGLFILYSRL